MGVCMGIIENQLETIYTPIYQKRMGLKYAKAKKMVRGILKQLKNDSQQDGTYYLPTNYGNQLLEKEKTDEKIKAMLSEARKEGANDDDIRKYWNLHELERRILIIEDDERNMAMALNYVEKGYTIEESSKEVGKCFPIYGLSKNAPALKGDDKPLPEELRDRINIYIEKRSRADPDKFKNEANNFTSFNAFIRNEIKKGNL